MATLLRDTAAGTHAAIQSRNVLRVEKYGLPTASVLQQRRMMLVLAGQH